MITRLTDKMIFRNRYIEISADVLLIMGNYFSINTVYPVEGIMSTGRITNHHFPNFGNNYLYREYEKALRNKLKDIFAMIFAFVEHKDKIQEYLDESGWEILDELEGEELASLRKKAEEYNPSEGLSIDIFSTLFLRESAINDSLCEKCLQKVISKTELLCGYRIEKENFLKLIKTDMMLLK